MDRRGWFAWVVDHVCCIHCFCLFIFTQNTPNRDSEDKDIERALSRQRTSFSDTEAQLWRRHREQEESTDREACKRIELEEKLALQKVFLCDAFLGVPFIFILEFCFYNGALSQNQGLRHRIKFCCGTTELLGEKTLGKDKLA